MAFLPNMCMNCLKPLPEGAGEEDPCPFCGDLASRPNPANCLQIGAVLSERYAVGRMQRIDGDAAVYAGYDTVAKSPISIREFFPDTLCTRGEDDRLVPGAGGEQTFEEYLNKFLVHARKVARMRDLPASIPVYDIFRENDTAYTVSERCEGKTLAAWLEERGEPIPWEEARPLFVPMMTSLISLHKAEVYHLGLSPETLILGDDGKLHIDGFAIPEARQVGGELTPLLASGYAAPEQYDGAAPCGPATDVYGLGAVIFRTLVGTAPPDGETRPRSNGDLTVPAEVADTLPPHVAAALFGALQPAADKRIGTLTELRDRLAAAPAVAELLNEEEGPDPAGAVLLDEEEEEEEPENRSRRGLWITLALIAFFILLAVGTFLLLNKLYPDLLSKLFPGHFKGSEKGPSTVTTITTADFTEATTTPIQPDMLAPVPNVMNRDYAEVRGRTVDNWAIALGGLRYDSAPEGWIVGQEPAPGEMGDFSQPIKVYISAGPETVVLPDLTGWKQSHAEQLLRALGMTVTVDVVAQSAQEAGCVDGTSPARGSTLRRGEEVRLRVSSKAAVPSTTPTTTAPTSAPVYETIPDLTGWPREYAQVFLETLGFEVEVLEVADPMEAGCVVETSPYRYSRLLKGSQVILRVSTGPGETPPSVPDNNGSTTPPDGQGDGGDTP